MAKIATDRENSIRVLLAAKDNVQAAAVMAELEKTSMSLSMRRVATRNEFLQFIETFGPQFVVVDYDFGGFLFVHELREKHPEIPFVILADVESCDKGPRQGLNIYILKSEIRRLRPWINVLGASGLFKGGSEDTAAQKKNFFKATGSAAASRR